MLAQITFHLLVSSNVPSMLPCMRAKSLQSCLTLCDHIECSAPGSSVHEFLQARILEWVAISFSWLSDPGFQPMVLTSPALAFEFFNISTT